MTTKKRAAATAQPEHAKPQPAFGAIAFAESSYYENLLRIQSADPERFELSTSDACKTALEFYLRARQKANEQR